MSVSKIKTYIGTDGKIHFIDKDGADSVLNFSNSSSDIIATFYSTTSETDKPTIYPINYNTDYFDSNGIVKKNTIAELDIIIGAKRTDVTAGVYIYQNDAIIATYKCTVSNNGIANLSLSTGDIVKIVKISYVNLCAFIKLT